MPSNPIVLPAYAPPPDPHHHRFAIAIPSDHASPAPSPHNYRNTAPISNDKRLACCYRISPECKYNTKVYYPAIVASTI